MAIHSLQDFIRRLCRARGLTEDGQLSDAQLLERFAARHDEAAFEVLVWRHGDLVLNVTRRLLPNDADREDVFQATFLTLARKASTIRRSTSLGSWLYKVAYRLAVRLRQDTAKRERRTGPRLDIAAAPEVRTEDDLSALLAEEVNRLPERYRSAVVLCYLQGATTEQAARVLGCPRGTVLSRLSSARQRLRARLVRRGVAPVLAATAVAFGEAVSAKPPAALVASVVRAALPFAAGRAAVPMVSSHAAALARGALQTMLWNKIKIVAAITCVLALAGSGTGFLMHPRPTIVAAPLPAEPQEQKDKPQPAAKIRENAIMDELKMIHARMNDLAAEEEKREKGISEEVILVRLRLIRAREKLRIGMESQKRELERVNRRIDRVQLEIEKAEAAIEEIQVKATAQIVQQEAQIRFRELRRNEMKKLRVDEAEILKRDLDEFHLNVFKEEEMLHHLEARQARQRESYALQRDALTGRLQQLENQSLGLDSTDNPRSIERKLDALRREVGELRRTLEQRKER